jgi:short-subunit dehydrogenase
MAEKRAHTRQRTALITGASSGIGEATAKALAKEGYRVILLARSKDRLERVASGIAEQGGSALAYSVDLSKAEEVSEAARRILAEAGVPDVIINNAGAGRWLSVLETAPAEFEGMMAVPCLAAFYVTRAFLPRMLERGSGHIVNVCSVAGPLVWPGAAGYAAARAALRSLSRTLHTELAGTGVGVSTVMFGKVRSTFWEHNPGSEQRLPRANAFLPTLTTEQAAGVIVKSIEEKASEVVRPRMFRLIFFLDLFFPRTTERVMHIGWKTAFPPCRRGLRASWGHGRRL